MDSDDNHAFILYSVARVALSSALTTVVAVIVSVSCIQTDLKSECEGILLGTKMPQPRKRFLL